MSVPSCALFLNVLCAHAFCVFIYETPVTGKRTLLSNLTPCRQDNAITSSNERKMMSIVPYQVKRQYLQI